MQFRIHFAGILIVILILFSFILPFSTVADDSPKHVGLRSDAPKYALWGKYWVGTMEFVIENEERPLPVTVWYPAVKNEDSDYAVYDMGISDIIEDDSFIHTENALVGVEPVISDAPYPLVVISHGLGGTRFGHYGLSEHLASYGFVVLSVEHIGTAIRDGFYGTAVIGSKNTVRLLYYRPSDIVAAIDFADQLSADDGQLEGMIDMEHIAVWGHSTGGTTALQAGGASINFKALSEWCADKKKDDYAAEACQFLGHEDQIAALYGSEISEDGMLPALWDARVDAVVAAAPGGELHAFGDSGMAEIQVPTMLIVGTLDPIVSPEYNSYWAYEQISSETKTLVKFENAGHLIFVKCPAFCGYDAVWDLDRAQDLTNYFTTAFLLDVLKGDEKAHQALMSEKVDFPGIIYETTMK